ncbi:sporulation peptidase YabG [Heliophilum fasciatum]|uniref:Spore coat assembly protein n=1 Tax=Heliophilum fasciatum TaxID=35700 RepID=A0A4R2RY16_9FIRM|nr:sporulation peptidase YabG [Heliophilum fasciatum]MCW2277011.1 spore coat assembly protein [Heliophilum fasciatum]TCP68463.1 spore coat assembly protein [Heliophilum fasciatum]
MREVRVGDSVTRNSYGNDIFFRVVEITPGEEEPDARLQGLDVRLEADAPLSDLQVPPLLEVFRYRQRMLLLHHKRLAAAEAACAARSRGSSDDGRPRRVLHLDGDEEALSACLDAYRKLNIAACGYFHEEKEFADVVGSYLESHPADFLVLTGHDGAYRLPDGTYKQHHTEYLTEAIAEARRRARSGNDLKIVAGACQSCAEALRTAGADAVVETDQEWMTVLDPVLTVKALCKQR